MDAAFSMVNTLPVAILLHAQYFVCLGWGAQGAAQGGHQPAASEAPAAAPAGAPGGSEWQVLYDPQQRPYYYNSTTRQSQWEKPAGMP